MVARIYKIFLQDETEGGNVVLQHRYPNLHITYARNLRHTMTDAERKLWNVLRHRIIAGLKWRRQQPVGPYIVDFYCSAKKPEIPAVFGSSPDFGLKPTKPSDAYYLVKKTQNNTGPA